MTICLEPILAPVEDGELKGLFVVEDMVGITGDGAEVLSRASSELRADSRVGRAPTRCAV